MIKRGAPSKAASALSKARENIPEKRLYDDESPSTNEPAVFSSPVILRLEERFRSGQRQLHRDIVEQIVHLGGILQEAKPHLGKNYNAWLKRLGISVRTAFNYEGVTAISESNAELVRDYAVLGANKWYMLVHVRPDKLTTVLDGDEKRKAEMEQMSESEFAAFLKPYVKRKRKPTPTVEQRSNGFRNKCKSWRPQIKEFSDYIAEHLDDDLPVEMLEEFMKLKEVVDEFELLLASREVLPA